MSQINSSTVVRRRPGWREAGGGGGGGGAGGTADPLGYRRGVEEKVVEDGIGPLTAHYGRHVGAAAASASAALGAD